MTKIRLQFHARRSEVADMAASWASDFGLWVALESFAPIYHIELVAAGELDERFHTDATISRIGLSVRPLDVECEPPLGLLRSNPDSLVVLLGTETDKRLGESTLQAMTDDPDSLKVWRRVRRLMVAELGKGVTAVNVATNATNYSADHYYSNGARELLRQGVRISGPTELIRYEF